MPKTTAPNKSVTNDMPAALPIKYNNVGDSVKVYDAGDSWQITLNSVAIVDPAKINDPITDYSGMISKKQHYACLTITVKNLGTGAQTFNDYGLRIQDETGDQNFHYDLGGIPDYDKQLNVTLSQGLINTGNQDWVVPADLKKIILTYKPADKNNQILWSIPLQ